ncbi:MAG: hypothetical protein ACYTGH_21730, partial [Planctomycetota bacterium]
MSRQVPQVMARLFEGTPLSEEETGVLHEALGSTEGQAVARELLLFEALLHRALRNRRPGRMAAGKHRLLEQV